MDVEGEEDDDPHPPMGQLAMSRFLSHPTPSPALLVFRLSFLPRPPTRFPAPSTRPASPPVLPSSPLPPPLPSPLGNTAVSGRATPGCRRQTRS